MKKSLSHTVWDCKYHIVWIPKRRKKILYGKLRKEVGTILRKICEYKSVELLEGNACLDFGDHRRTPPEILTFKGLFAIFLHNFGEATKFSGISVF